jgi:hypothetical protein
MTPMARNRTVPEKVSDWLMAYNAIRAEITPPQLSKMFAVLTAGEATTPGEALTILQQSMSLARLIEANDRMAAMAAAVITSSGGARPVVLDEETSG